MTIWDASLTGSAGACLVAVEQWKAKKERRERRDRRRRLLRRNLVKLLLAVGGVIR